MVEADGVKTKKIILDPVMVAKGGFKLINDRAIKTLREKFNCNTGYSGHETGIAVSYAAASLGISSLERHITLDRAMYGSDQSASLEPSGLRQLIGGVRKIEKAMGDGVKRIIDDEVPIADKLRAHINFDSIPDN